MKSEPSDAERAERNLLRQPLHPEIDEALIERLVVTFYDRIRADAVLAPIFAAEIADWGSHLSKMCDFWSSIMLKSGRYHGRPMPVHARLQGVEPAHFARWLSLFRKTAAEVASPEVAAIFIDRAERIAESFKLGMFGRRPS
ncbi:group III truncated hemoglobin [Amorphus sp. 3PC139-8]|uniref:group III truncated hemoglobin n=1 Tax=Amorphus sp. 3PC139-8 TaxID=2735676 RepID=UPI00345CD85F